ncbi:hypothetical protein CLOM_g5973 [Closterium sp. NIES-68]|nr:hypothetical protein CLOM_g5973 [Closterium sp. NIES-68]GJP86374.1 hypothetical protein CLOP_g16401 [Closterium sp. NIES-67]
MADTTPLDLSIVDRLELADDGTAVNWRSYANTLAIVLHTAQVNGYTLHHIVTKKPSGLPPPPPMDPGPAPPPLPAPPPPMPDAPEHLPPPHPDEDSAEGECAIQAYTARFGEYVLQELAVTAAQEALDSATAAHAKHAAATAEYAEAQRRCKAWKVADARAVCAILSTLPMAVKRGVANTSSSSALWQELQDRFDPRDFYSTCRLLDQYDRITLDNSTSALDYTRRLANSAADLLDRSVELPRLLQIRRLFRGLPPSFSPLATAYQSKMPTDVTVDAVVEWVISTDRALRCTAAAHAHAEQPCPEQRGGGRRRRRPRGRRAPAVDGGAAQQSQHSQLQQANSPQPPVLLFQQFQQFNLHQHQQPQSQQYQQPQSQQYQQPQQYPQLQHQPYQQQQQYQQPQLPLFPLSQLLGIYAVAP